MNTSLRARRSFSVVSPITCLVLALTLHLPPAAKAQVIPAARSFVSSWRNAGYQGEIPAPAKIVNVRDYGALGNGATNDAPAIAAAIAALGGSGGVVFFPSGTYCVPNDTIRLTSGVVLRGERSSNTEILATNLLLTQTAVISISGSDPGTPWQDILSGYDIHSQTVCLTNVTSFAAGDWVETHEGTNVAWQMTPNFGPDMIGQILQVTNVTVTNSPAGTLTFASPLRLQYEPGLMLDGAPINPQIRKFDRAIQNAGVENLRISRVVAGDSTNRNNVASISLWYAINCWVRGCEFTNLFGSAVSGSYSANCDITGNYIHHAYEFDGGGSGYGVVFQFRSCEMLVENNIMKRLRHSMLLQGGANGNVFGYNYSEDQWTTDLIPTNLVPDMVCHGNYPYANLFEGNCGSYMNVDSSHGMNGPYNTFFRNRGRLNTYVPIFYNRYMGGFEVNDPLGTNQTFVGNEVRNRYMTNNVTPFEYGNATNNIIAPLGTDILPDYSYYLGTSVTNLPTVPNWWNIPKFIPVYGPTNAAPIPPFATERDIPARARWNAGGPYTYAPPSLALQPTNSAVNQGGSVSFSVTAYGTPRAFYQWKKDGVPLLDETNAALIIASAAVSDVGTYSAMITDSCGQVTSAGATLAVQGAELSLLITSSPGGSATPSGLVSVPSGATTGIDLTAGPYYHLADLLTNSASIGGTFGMTGTNYTWGPAFATGTLHAVFAETLTSNGIPHSWLAHYGLGTINASETNNPDHDPHDTLCEWIALTDPTNEASFLEIDIGQAGASNQVGFSTTHTGRWYSILRAISLHDELLPVTNFAGTGAGWHMRADDGSASTSLFFRGSVRVNP